MATKIDGYHSIRTSTLVGNRRLAMDVFVIIEDRAVRYGAEGEILDEDRYQRLRKFKLNKVLIQESKESVYRGYLEEMLDSVEKNAKIETSLKAQMLTAGAESAAEEVIQKVEDKDIYQDAQLQFERFARFLQKHDGGLKEVLRLSGTVAGDYVCHGVQVAALSVFMCEKLKLIQNEAHAKLISTGCFIHDIGAERTNIPLVADKSQLTPEQLKTWQTHPTKGLEILSKLDHVERQVMDIVIQHEEIPNGSGFPNKLVRLKMDPVACVVSLANRFDHYSTRFRGDKKAAMAKFFIDEMGKYDLDQMELLKKVITEQSS